MEIIPAIDLRDGKCVRLVQGRYDQETIFGDDPAAMASHWEGQGAQRLHVVDLDGAREGVPRNLGAVGEIVRAVRAPVELGGGLRDLKTIERVLELGVDRVVVGTAALDRARVQELVEAVGERLVAGIDAREGRVAVRGWQETTEVEPLALARELAGLGVRWFVFTDILRDGMLHGPNTAALRRIVESVDASVIASGGIATIEHVRAVREAGAAAAIIGTALYAGRLTLRAAMEAAC